MPTTLTAGDAVSNSSSLAGANDGALNIIVGPAGSKVAAITIDALGRVAMPLNVVAFSAFPTSNQSITSGAFARVTLQAEEFDTANYFDAVTNSVFQPLVAGYYLINGMVAISTTSTNVICSIFKNNVEFKRGQQTGTSSNAGVSTLMFFNGSTDFVDMRVFLGLTQTLSGAPAQTYFQGYLVAKA